MRQGLPLFWKLAVLARLAGQQVPGSACLRPDWGARFNSLLRISVFLFPLLQLKWMQSELNVEEVVNDRSWKVGNNVGSGRELSEQGAARGGTKGAGN